MLFTEALFIAFFLVAFGVHWLLPIGRPRRAWLLACSYVFYAGWKWEFLGLIIASTVLDYSVGLALAKHRESVNARRWLVALSLAGNLGVLGFFKYYDFFVVEGAALLGFLGFDVEPTTLGLILPVGISFYTFQTLSYTIDVARGRLEATRNLLDFALFVAFFPQLVAGPIVRASEFLPQLMGDRVWGDVAWRASAWRFLSGWVKKACIADNVALVTDAVYGDPGAYDATSMWLAALLYAVQVYADFSGYTDMAIGTAGLLGFRLPENFNYPYLSKSLTELWQRWHMTLTTWFRDYVYIPLGGNRSGPVRTYVNLFSIFLLCGLWHGAGINYIVWGIFNGVFLIVERAFRGRGRNSLILRVLGHPYTLVLWLAGLTIFRTTSMENASAALKNLAFMGGTPTAEAPHAAWWLAVLGFTVIHLALAGNWWHKIVRRLPLVVVDVAYGLAWAIALPFAAADYAPFVYFQF